MRRPSLALIVLFAMFGGIVTPSELRAAPPEDSPSARPVRIVGFGDSITKGVRPGVTAEQTFVAMLEKRLRDRKIPAEVINLGVGSERTDLALKRFDQVLAQSPTHVLIMYGANDSYVDPDKTQPRVLIEDFKKNLIEMIERLRAEGIEPILMTEPRVAAGARNGVGEDPNVWLAKFMEVCREVAQAHGVDLVDNYAVWSAAERDGVDLNTWTTDRVHPNAIGHAKITDAIERVLVKKLADEKE